MENKKTRNKPTHYGTSITFRINTEKFDLLKEVCERRGLKYNEVLRDLVDQFLRANN